MVQANDNEVEISTINHAYISVLPRQPCYDWANKVFVDNAPMGPEEREATSYAIRDEFAVRHLAEVVKPYFPFIFEMELQGVCTDPDKWPKQ